MTYTPSQEFLYGFYHGDDDEETGNSVYSLPSITAPCKLTHLVCRGSWSVITGNQATAFGSLNSIASLGILYQAGGSAEPAPNGDTLNDFNWVVPVRDLWSVTDNPLAVAQVVSGQDYAYTSSHGFTVEAWPQLNFAGSETWDLWLCSILKEGVSAPSLGYKMYHSTWIDLAIGGSAQP